jgi:hypothetical protein
VRSFLALVDPEHHKNGSWGVRVVESVADVGPHGRVDAVLADVDDAFLNPGVRGHSAWGPDGFIRSGIGGNSEEDQSAKSVCERGEETVKVVGKISLVVQPNSFPVSLKAECLDVGESDLVCLLVPEAHVFLRSGW